MSSPTSAKSSASVKRGPTLRGGRYRAGIGRSVRVPPSPSRSNNGQEEEMIGLTAQGSTFEEDFTEKPSFEDIYTEKNNNRLSQKVETDEHGKPKYEHGGETFGDILTHPIEELHAHQHRKESFKSKIGRWSLSRSSNSRSGDGNINSARPVHEDTIDYAIVLHFRQLRGNQRFVLSHDAATDFCKRLKFTQEEKIQFNGIHDTDSLTEFLYKIKRDFSIKIHHKSDYYRNSSSYHLSGEHIEAPLPVVHHHNPDHHTIDFNENVYIEFKPKQNHHMEALPVEATRRPFFQHPEPDLSADIGEETAASWLELFYDLFFVATLTEFTHSHHIKDWDSLGLYAQWFVITWWAWCASSLYTARFDTDDVVHHIYKFVEMCALIGMAGSSEYFLNSSGYVYGYITLKAVLTIEYFVVFVVAILAKSKSRTALACYIGANLLSIALWASSLVILEQGVHRVLWYLGVGSEILVNAVVRRNKSLSWAASHLAERLGLLSLIVLGENLMGLVTLVSAAGTNMIIVIPNFMAVLIIFGFFFMYFEDFNKEIFLHNKYHQIWVYLHFPLHLCQVAFGISLIDILKIYRSQLIRDKKLSEDDVSEKHTASSGETSHGSEPSSGHSSPPASTAAHGEQSDSAGHNEPTATSNEHATPSSATHHAKRAILMVNNDYSDKEEFDYNPMEMTRMLQEEQRSQSTRGQELKNNEFYLSLWFKSMASTMVISAMQLIASGGYYDESYNGTASGHHLVRRSEPAGEGGSASSETEHSFTDSMTVAENQFVYKTFLIFAGLILVINSLIKALNTKVADIYGKIIIVSRILNAIILWSMCALPFAKLDAIVLLCTLVGSLVFQAMVDLLD
ncbi:unnamed protein product [Mucor hiemalis]